MSILHWRIATLFVMVAIALSLPFITGCDSAKKDAQAAFEAASATLDEKNAEVDAAVADVTEAMASEIKPLDESCMTACEEAVSAAQAAKVTAPEMATTAEEISAQAHELEATDYSAQLEAIATAKQALLDSIKQREQIANPTDAFVIQRLTGIDHIQTPTAVTEDMDPNGKLNKQGGYTATVYFLSDYVDQAEVYANGDIANEVIDKGTEGGGAVEVYANEDDANKRNGYLASFDGTVFSSGYHAVHGTCVVRVSDKMTASQQQELEAAVVEALTRLE